MVLWIFENSENAKIRIDKNNRKPAIWDRIICLWSEQTTYERNWERRLNINGIYIKWEKWEPGKPGHDWKDKDPIDYELLIDRLYNIIKTDMSFQSRIQGKPWDPGKPGKDWEDAVIDIKYVIEKLIPRLIDNKYFVEKCRAKDWAPGKPGKDWEDGKPWAPGKPGKDWEDAIDGNNWSIIHIIPEFKEWLREKIDICIDYQRNIYYLENNTVKKIPFNI